MRAAMNRVPVPHRRQAWLAAALLLASGAVLAQASPVGRWKTFDDSTGKAMAEIVIAPVTTGALHGRIDKSITQDSEPLCSLCTDERKNQPKVGMEIIRGLRPADGGTVWEGGKILDPENGKEYTVRITPLDAGKRLQVRGYIGPFYRTQVWQRIE